MSNLTAEQLYLLQTEGLSQKPSLQEQYTDFINRREIAESSRLAGALSTIDTQLVERQPNIVFLEATPIYAKPLAQRPTQALNHPAAFGTFHVSDQARQIVEGRGVPSHHWVMIDDVNNNADRLSQEHILENFSMMQSAIPILGTASEVVLESRFKSNGVNKCGALDAHFQHAKLAYARFNQGSEAQPMLMVFHPITFVDQQLLMLNELYSILKKDPAVSQRSKGEKQQMAVEPFMHVWTSEAGDVIDVTRPMWRNGSIRHETI